MSGGNALPDDPGPDDAVLEPGDDVIHDDVTQDEIRQDEVRPDDVRPDDARPRAKKAPNAFRTISEVADELHIPQHVLRFWETKFPQIKPLKRGGGRRYYRPDDILLLRRISDLLYIQGYTIKGVQRLLREGGGQLSEDIPPATAAERAAAEAEQADITPVMPPDLITPVTPGVDEVARLRAVLNRTLGELMALRALLD